MIYTVCCPAIISGSITALYGSTRQKPGVIEAEEKGKREGRTGRMYGGERWKAVFRQPELY